MKLLCSCGWQGTSNELIVKGLEDGDPWEECPECGGTSFIPVEQQELMEEMAVKLSHYRLEG